MQWCSGNVLQLFGTGPVFDPLVCQKKICTAHAADLWGGTCGDFQACHLSPPHWSSINQTNHATSPHLITNQNMTRVEA